MQSIQSFGIFISLYVERKGGSELIYLEAQNSEVKESTRDEKVHQII